MAHLKDDAYKENHGEMLEVTFDKHLSRSGDSRVGLDEVDSLAEVAKNDWNVLERMKELTLVFETRKSSILQHIRAAKSENIPSITPEQVTEMMLRYEQQLGERQGAESMLSGFFIDSKPEVILDSGHFCIVKDKEHFFLKLSAAIHKELFEKPEFFKHVSGVFAIRTNERDEKEVFMVKSKKTGIWQFPGGKAEYLSTNPTTGKVEFVTKRENQWLFADGSVAGSESVKLESPEQCLRREVKEELGTDIKSVTLESSGLYTIGSSRFIIHGFIANNIIVDLGHLKRDEIEEVEWTSTPFREKDGVPRQMTDQTSDVLSHWFTNSEKATG